MYKNHEYMIPLKSRFNTPINKVGTFISFLYFIEKIKHLPKNMKKLLLLFLSFSFYNCSSDHNIENEIEKPTISLTTSIIQPLKDRDFSFHNNGVHGVFEDPTVSKKLKAKIELSEVNNSSKGTLNVKWKSDKDGLLYEGKPDDNLESVININLSKGFHKIFFEVYTADNSLIKKDSITISNVIKLEALSDTGRSIKLNWSKYEGNNFISYLVYGENSKPIAEITDINILTYEYLETISLVKEQKFQIVVKTTDLTDRILGSNIVSKMSGNFIEFPYFVPKMIKDNLRSKIYVLVAPRSKWDETDKYGILIIDTKNFKIESHILTSDRFSDLDISPDGQYLYLTQKYVEKLTKINLATMEVKTFTTSTNDWGFHKIEVGNNNILFCHITPPTSGSTGIMAINGMTGETINMSYNAYLHGDIEYNSKNGKLYMGESNTSAGVIYCNTFINQNLRIENNYPIFPNSVVYPDPFLFISDDYNFIFWEKYQLDLNLNVKREFNTKMIACSPNNFYLSDMDKIYNYNNLSVVFNYPPFPSNESTKSTLFIDDNTIITCKTYQPNTVGEPAQTYFFKMKIN
ncbi:hypothetical protein EV142_101913 [Flavobacterium circumlabens]|uniref:Uncharacterized protein n=2 Tax=Flavobacterium circumlabens TaxID=2133765 RepID=A0ABY2B622_9FLAO|nr:hypothetical protein EV142_101913 [Flavobacterium circumlabens]